MVEKHPVVSHTLHPSRTMLLDFLLPLPVSTFTWLLLGSLKGLLNTSSNARSFRKVVMDGSRRRVAGAEKISRTPNTKCRHLCWSPAALFYQICRTIREVRQHNALIEEYRKEGLAYA